MRLHALFLSTAALALSACASGPTPSASNVSAGRDCFRAASAHGFGLVDDHHVRVSISPNQNYILTTRLSARSLDWSQAIAIDGPSYICTGNGLGVTLIGGEPRQHFQISEIRRIPPDTQPEGS